MATKIASLFAEIKADTTHLERGLKETNQRLEQTKGRSDKAASSVSKFGAAAKIAAAAGVAILVSSLGQFLRSSVQTASAVEEMSSKFEVVFGEQTPRAIQELEAFGDEVNRSKFELMGMASTLQDTFVPMGFTRKAAADLSIELTKLATDVASFNNASDAAVVRDFQSALVGNHETVRKYGIVITEAALKQEAYSSGIADLGSELDTAQKVQARLNLIMAGTVDAQGDAARTADSFANASRGLAASIKDLEVAVGEGLIPAIKEAMPWWQGLIDRTTEAIVEGNEMRDAMAAMGAEVREGAGPAMVRLADGTMITTIAFMDLVEASRQSGEQMRAIRSAGLAAGEGIASAGAAAAEAGPMLRTAMSALFDEEGNLRETDERMKGIVAALERMQELQGGGREALVENVGASQLGGQAGKLGSLVQGDTFTAEGTLGSSIEEGAQRIREDLNPALAEAQTGAGNITSEAASMFVDPLQDVRDIKAEVDELDGRIINVNINYNSTGGIPEFETGGIVPGAIGQPQIAVIHGGEEVKPHPSTDTQANMNGPLIGSINVSSEIDGMSMVNTLRDQIRRMRS